MPKILIVDDDPVVHMLYKRHLEGEGFELLMAADGAEALSVAAQTKPDLIVMDIMMPGQDGLATLRVLKADEAMRDVPVIVITANVSQYEAIGKEAKFGGAAILLTKPLSPSRLVSEVRRVFPRR